MASSSNVGQSSSSHSRRLSWPPEPIPPVGYLSRKALPIKRSDAEALTREDVQYDLLNHIFSDTKAVFTPQTPEKADKITFKELYINALYNSNKCSKVLKEKMIETPAFGVELAKISLLTNVGRINTTMAFFPEMKTALRTYHPVPSLQKTDGNAQDAPRIKNCLKAALLPSEFKSLPPSTPEEVLEKKRAGQIPPTSVVNLIFVLSNHAAPLASIHFDGTFNFLDLFLPKPLSSSDRARVFLWLMFHYLESSNTNPFDDEYSRNNPTKAPLLRTLSASEMARENIDTREEIEWGRTMSARRNQFLQKLVSAMESEKKTKPAAPHFVPAVPQPNGQPSGRRSRRTEPTKEEAAFMYYVPGEEPAPTPPPVREPPRRETLSRSQSAGTAELGRPEDRSMLQHAWHTVMTTDPLGDSDDDGDEYSRLDYARRLGVISRIRQRPPTPEAPIQQPHTVPIVHTRSSRNSPFTGRWQRVESWD
ncbi:hypothetical protein K435DRAFT_724230 [Dendrothele bispora CBS 962.96]|uniref:Ino eighty subunit 1 n=1 Tax=Dendrothele bispora (strain CBS 962.96) TaxID=1314807 RepID=A0A4S8LYS1_DENBC|nr:hypothetical protein K435DRAFT_724230 [Dendrothele bispora CBS 962.96]